MESYEQILEQIYKIIQPWIQNSIELSEQTDLIDDLGFDSLKMMELIPEIEDQWDIAISLKNLPDIRKIKDLTLQIQQLTGGNE